MAGARRAAMDQQDPLAAPFVFAGRVVRRGAATVVSIPVTATTAIVAVDQVFRWPEGVVDFSGGEVTVELLDPDVPKIDQPTLFSAQAWFYGDGLALREVSSMRSDDADRTRRRVEDAARREGDEVVIDRIRRADLAVVGTVRETRPAGGEARPPFSEHDPLWHEALVDVEAVERGQPPEGQLLVLFPNSSDEFWYDSPKFKAGDGGLFLLQRNQKERGPTQFRRDGLTALDPNDFHPWDRMERALELVRSQR